MITAVVVLGLVTVLVPETRVHAQQEPTAAEVAELRAKAERGDADAQNDLGFIYAYGQGVPEDDAEAVRWYRLAADQGHADAQYIVGFMYANGEGVPQDYVAAHMWFNLVAAQSSGEDRDRWVKNRDLVAAKMTAEQVAEAQRLAREWTPTQEP